ncbi:MAG: ABC transporter ATP-binding protein [Rhodanobacter sp.]|nr:ABC transporter ATP-binding protein [Rhodanobacter sp.]
MKIISVTGLEKKYGNVQALKGISFEVGRGEIFAMLGPNGSGKTTTLEILLGLRRHEAGKIEYFDANGQIGRMPRVGAVFQGRVYYESLTVRELTKYYRDLYRAPPHNISRYLDMVNLKEKLDTQYSDLSGGQQQQIAIVLALVNDPEVLFFDEPSSALDPQVRLKIWGLIRNLKSEGKTIIFTTHYIEEAEALADRVSILSKGELVITDSPTNIVRRHSENYTVEFSFEEDAGGDVFNGFSNVWFRDGIYSFSVDAIDGDLMQALKEISDKHKLSRISIGKSSLQSVFVKITEEKGA